MDVPCFLNTRLPLFSLRVRGKWKKDVIFQVINGRQCMRSYSAYDGSEKDHLKPFYSKFAAAIWFWQQMPLNQRRWFNSRASKLGLQMSGYNYFIRLYTTDKLGDFVAYPDPHHLSHERLGADEVRASGKLSLRPSLDLGTVGQREKPTIITVGVFRCLSMPIWSTPVNQDEQLYYETRVPRRWDGVSDFVVPVVVCLAGAEVVGSKFRFQLSWQHDSCGGVIPATWHDVEVEVEVLVGRNATHDCYCASFVLDYDIAGAGNEVKAGDILAGRLRRVAASSDEVTNEVMVRHQFEVEQSVNKYFGSW